MNSDAGEAAPAEVGLGLFLCCYRQWAQGVCLTLQFSELLGWPKVPSVFHKMLWKNPNEIFGQPNSFLCAVRIPDPTLSSVLASLDWYKLKITTLILFACLLCDA